jgi:hypothetical protein
VADDGVVGEPDLDPAHTSELAGALLAHLPTPEVELRIFPRAEQADVPPLLEDYLVTFDRNIQLVALPNPKDAADFGGKDDPTQLIDLAHDPGRLQGPLH